MVCKDAANMEMEFAMRGTICRPSYIEVGKDTVMRSLKEIRGN